MSNVVVSGYYGSKNAGDEAMLAATIEVLSDIDPQVNITVISADPADTKKRHGVDSIPWLSVCDIIRALRDSDLLISGGGSLLQNVTSGRSLYYYLCIIALARLLGKRVMLYAQGIGPVYGGFARGLMKFLLNGVSMITVRDNGSLQELKELAVTIPPIEVTADPVLAIHPVDVAIGQNILQKYALTGRKPIVGISVREWQGWPHYKEVLAKVVDAIIDEYDAEVVFLPMQVPEDVKTANIIESLTRNKVTVLTEEYNTSELLSLVGTMEILISIRLHALIFAGVMGIPMIGISYDPKIERFLDSIGEKTVGDLKSLSVEAVMAAVKEKWNGKEAFQQKRISLISELRRLSVRNAEAAVALVNE